LAHLTVSATYAELGVNVGRSKSLVAMLICEGPIDWARQVRRRSVHTAIRIAGGATGGKDRLGAPVFIRKRAAHPPGSSALSNPTSEEVYSYTNSVTESL